MDVCVEERANIFCLFRTSTEQRASQTSSHGIVTTSWDPWCDTSIACRFKKQERLRNLKLCAMLIAMVLSAVPHRLPLNTCFCWSCWPYVTENQRNEVAVTVWSTCVLSWPNPCPLWVYHSWVWKRHRNFTVPMRWNPHVLWNYCGICLMKG